jgi:hypothetical protein
MSVYSDPVSDEAFVVLEIPQTDQNDIARIYPHFLPHLSSNMSKPLLARPP